MPADAYAIKITSKNATEKDFKKIDGDLRGLELTIGGVTSKMRSLGNDGVKSLGAISAAAVVGLGAIVVHSADAANELSNLSIVAGATFEEFQLMSAGARLYGVEQDKLSDILKDTNDKLGDFFETGGGAAADFFDNIAPKVGVTAAQFKNLSGPDALQLYYTSLEKANLSQAEMTFYMEAIASDATLLTPLLKNGGAAMREQAEEAKKLGLVLSDIEIGVLADVDVKIKQATAGLGAFTSHLAAEFAPIISAITDELLDATKEAGGFGEIASKVFNVVIEGAGYAANVVRGLQVTFLLVQGVIARTAEAVVDVFSLVENGYRQLANLIPGVEVETSGFLEGVGESMENVRIDIQNELAALAAAPLPHDSIVEWAQDVTSKVQDVIRETKAKALADGDGAGELDVTQDPEVFKAQARIKELKLLKALDAATELESEELAFNNKMEMLEVRFKGGELPTLQAFNNIKEILVTKHEANLTRISSKGATERQKFEKKSAADKTKYVLGQLETLTAGSAAENRKMFEVNKIASTANAIIHTFDGANAALKMGPWGIPIAAAIVVSGLANVATIQSTSFGGGASAVGSSPITTAPSNYNLSSIGPSAIEQETPEEEQEKRGVTIIFNGPVSSNNAETLLEDIKTLINEQDYILIESQSNNAKEIMAS